jgi:hypothetical protein
MYGARPLSDPAMAAARQVVELVLRGHEPYPALAIDRHWNVVMRNRAVGVLLAGVAPALLEPPINALRLSLHPEGLAPRIVNLAAWRGHVLARLRQQAAASGDETLVALETELAGHAPATEAPLPPRGVAGEPAIVVPLVIDAAVGRLSFISTTTVFGTPVDITLAELALETFFPADPATHEALRRALEGETSEAPPGPGR